MSNGVRVSRPTVWDGSNRGKVKGIMEAKWYLVQYVDQQGKESKTYALYANGHWYLPRNGTEMHDLDSHLAAPSAWMAKELQKIQNKIDPNRPKEKVEIPMQDAAEVD